MEKLTKTKEGWNYRTDPTPHNMESMLQEEELKSLSFKKLLFLKTKRTSHLRHCMGHVTL